MERQRRCCRCPKRWMLRVVSATLVCLAASAFQASTLQSPRQRLHSRNPNSSRLYETNETRRQRMRKRVSGIAQRIVQAAPPGPHAVAAVLKDATLNAVEMAVDEVTTYRKTGSRSIRENDAHGVDVEALIDEAFQPLEKSLERVESQLENAKAALSEAKQQSIAAMEAVEAAALAQTEGAVQAVVAAEKAASRKVLADIYVAAQENSTSTSTQLMAFEDVDYGTSEMAPPFIGEDQCLVPGEPVVRVERAPENSRRIFAGVDIPHSVDSVWNLLTDYEHLQDVVPNLVVNDVLEEYNTDNSTPVKLDNSSSLPEEKQSQQLAEQMKGAMLRQVGGAKVAGIRFSARTTLEVREWPDGLPDFAHFQDFVWEGKDRNKRAVEYSETPLTRYKFPRPFAVSVLPTRDISMQSVVDDDGEFRMYQGVWRMQPLPGCAPAGKDAMRLTYAVEISPRAYLPVQLIEGRIVRDLCTNLVAIRDYLAKTEA